MQSSPSATSTKRSKEEIRAEKEKQARDREARSSELRARCERATGVPCGVACVKRCERRALSNKAAKIRRASREALAKTREKDFARIDEGQQRRAASEMARYAVPAKRESPSKQFSKAEKQRESWRVAVLFMLGLTKEQIAAEIYGDPGIRLGAINKAITKGNLAAIRRERLIEYLIGLDGQPPKGMEGVVTSDAARFNKSVHAAFKHRRGIVPEQQIRIEGDRAFKRMVNVGTSQLHIAARPGGIREWNMLAGMELQDRVAGSGTSRLGAMDYSRDNVDGGASTPDGRILSTLHASDLMMTAKAKVLRAFAGDTTGPLRWALIEHVVLMDRPLDTYPIPAGVTDRPDRFLNEALEVLAFMFGVQPVGIQLKRVSSAAGQALAIIRADREEKLFNGTLAASVSPALREAGEDDETRRRRLFGS